MEPKKTKGTYCFPNIIAKMLKGVSQRTQYESSLMSLTVILLGIMIMTFYTIFYSPLSVFVKVVGAVNMVAAFVFLTSHLAMTYQQYISYLEVVLN